MALSLFGIGQSNSPFDPFWLESAWDPLELVQSAQARSHSQGGAGAIAGTKVDWLETDNAHVFKADLPGVKKEEIKVQLENDRILSITGERSHEEERKGDKWHRVERSYGKFLRRFKLPENAQADSISAKVDDGVLTVTIPKTLPKTTEKRDVKVA